MLTRPTIEKLKSMKLTGMAAALADQQRTPDINTLTFEERFALLIDREETTRADRRLKTRLTQAKLRMQASIEDIDYQARRNLDKALLLELAGCSWISRNFNLISSGPTGVGKTYLANALAHKACLENHRVLYTRLPRLLHDLETSLTPR
jgi:DNA replication protein DnaC